MGTEPGPEPAGEATIETAAPAPRRRAHLVGDTVLLLALLALAAAAGYLLRDGGAPINSSTSSSDSVHSGSTVTSSTPSAADAGFARDMQVHHAQAVEMSFLIRDRSDDPTINAVAYDIITSQQQQMGQMFAWLETWGLPQTGSAPAMAWMGQPSNPSSSMSTPMSEIPGHDMGDMSDMSDMSGDPGDRGGDMPTLGGGADGLMPGMATQRQMDQLRAADGRAAERMFLRLMIRHHRGGIAMAEAGRELASTGVVKRLSAAVITAQTAEIDQMQQLLAQRTKEQ